MKYSQAATIKQTRAPAGRGTADCRASLFPHALQQPPRQLSSYFYGNYNVQRGGGSGDGEEEGGYRRTRATCCLWAWGASDGDSRTEAGDASWPRPPLAATLSRPPRPTGATQVHNQVRDFFWGLQPKLLASKSSLASDTSTAHKKLQSLPCPVCKA